MKNYIIDIFGNKITVTDKTASWIQTNNCVKCSKDAGDEDFFFDEFDIKIGVDQWGKSYGYSVRRNNGKGVKALVYHSHNLTQIDKLT